jgi:hypothetical protein
VDAAQSLAALTAVSSQIVRCAIVEDRGGVVAAAPAATGAQLARVAAELLESAPRRSSPVESVEVDLDAGSVFVVREGSRVAVATTGPEPPSALVVHDLRLCLRRIESGASSA